MEIDMENILNETDGASVNDVGVAEVCIVNRYVICNQCNLLIAGIDNLDDHVCEEAEETNNEDASMFVGSNRQSTKCYQCEQCDRTFTQASNLKRHERIHSGERPFICEVCDRRFAQGNNLKAHMRLHTNERPYCCVHCDRTFAQSSNLHKHMRSHEDAETAAQYRRFTCAICEKSFVDSNVLRIHLRTHTGERPHSCSECNRSFTQESNLRRHFRTHTGEKPFVCNICSRGFSQSNNLKAHMAVHGATDRRQTVFECDECDTQFLRQTNLDKHKATVHGERRIVVITGSGRRLVGPEVKLIPVTSAEEQYITVCSE